jgi:hypothetical protein
MGQPRNKKYDDAFSLYEEGLSLSQVANELSVTRQSVYEAFRKRGFTLRKPNYQPVQWFDGKKFTLRNHGYFELTVEPRTLMHRYIWEKERWPIPIGWDVHHIDENKWNNRIENFECLPKSEHTRFHQAKKKLCK